MMNIERRITKSYFNLALCQYTPLIRKLAFRIGANSTQIEELEARASDELLKCMICYSRSGSFMTFFYGRLFGIFRHMRDAERRANRTQIVPIDFISDMAGPDNDMDSHMMVEECLECLDTEEREIIIDIFFDEKTMREISDDRSIATSTICRIKAGAIEKMRQKCKIELE